MIVFGSYVQKPVTSLIMLTNRKIARERKVPLRRNSFVPGDRSDSGNSATCQHLTELGVLQ